MKKTGLTLIFILLVFRLFAQGVTGDWYGALNIQGTSLPLVFHITKNGDTYSTLMDSPNQGAKGFATGITTVNGNELIISAAKAGITYTGTYLPDSNKIKGTFKQGAGSFPLTFSRTEQVTSVAPALRPQDPKDFPYKREDVVFDNVKSGDRLAGTLTMPTDGKASKIVILITGSGAQNRDEELMNHRPFLVWSDWLTRHGIAVLRYDDRGIAHSTGNFQTATTADFADDAEAAVTYIQSRADLKNLSIGLMGHSEGGLIAPMVASRNKAVKFIVLLAGPGVPNAELMVKQNADIARLAGASDDDIRRTSATNKKIYTFIIQNPNMPQAELLQKVDTLMYHDLRTYPGIKPDDKQLREYVQQQGMQIANPWMRYFIAMNSTDYLTKVKCPVLALDGTLDMQVNAAANLAAIKASLEKGGNKHFEIVPLDGLNHLFQKAKTGSPTEYGQIEETVNPVALEKVSGWINKL